LIGAADSVTSTSPVTALRAKLVPALLAAGLGCVLLFGAGFANISALHNAAHDARHSDAFPCH
jgi:cobalt transporter subunit CbtB